MSTLGEVAYVRSKNAGPFWITVDIFSQDAKDHALLCRRLRTEAVARVMRLSPEEIRRFEIDGLHVIKFSFRRPQVQGAIDDRDMHGAACACRLAEIPLD
ncbi:DUF4387 family protein [Thioalkalivibrio sp. HK1]|uniref:DUF4387 family protein n=1 Tax=Thioalkalivibrio sp. HK1 TaxID=1469245 RepID=UPI00046EDA40|nr:DUF4387 family protein [Thioalkalivibrio sp. HK1]